MVFPSLAGPEASNSSSVIGLRFSDSMRFFSLALCKLRTVGEKLTALPTRIVN